MSTVDTQGRDSALAALRLLAVALAAGALTAALGLAALQAARGLMDTPAAWWGMSQLGSAVVCLSCGAGALGALWHLASAALAVAALPWGRAEPTWPREAASHLLEHWGAPLVRRMAAGALVLGMASSPAMAAQAPASGDDLGWQPTSSASQEPQVEDRPQGTGRPGAPEPSAPEPPASDPARPEPGSPAHPRPPDPAPGPGAGSQQAGADPAPATPSPQEPRPPAPGPDGQGAPSSGGAAAGRHVVAPGESLWSITARLLADGADDAAIARAWPALYRANAETIGPDPWLIRPGTSLVVPEDLPGARPAGEAQS